MEKTCGHARSFKERCVECELILAREGLAFAQQKIEKYSKLIAELEPESQPMGAPWVEYGAGWAKVHFRREVTDRDRVAIDIAMANLQLSGSKMIAGERIDAGQAIGHRGTDGKFYRAHKGGHLGIAVAQIDAGKEFELDTERGGFRPVTSTFTPCIGCYTRGECQEADRCFAGPRRS